MKLLFLMALSHVDFTGEKQAACRYFARSVEVSFLRMMTAALCLIVGKACWSDLLAGENGNDNGMSQRPSVGFRWPVRMTSLFFTACKSFLDKTT